MTFIYELDPYFVEYIVCAKITSYVKELESFRLTDTRAYTLRTDRETIYPWSTSCLIIIVSDAQLAS